MEKMVQCRSSLFQEKFTGRILKKYNKTYLIEIVEYSEKDRNTVEDFLGKIVVSKKRCVSMS